MADQGCERPWVPRWRHGTGIRARYVLGDQKQEKRKFAKTTEFDEEFHSAKTFKHKNRFQAIAVRDADAIDDATTNMEDCKNIPHKSLMRVARTANMLGERRFIRCRELLGRRSQCEYAAKQNIVVVYLCSSRTRCDRGFG